MTKKAAVILAPGCEEIEALSVVDVLRRLNVKCDMVGLFETKVDGDHGILLTATRLLMKVCLTMISWLFQADLKVPKICAIQASLKS